MLDRLLVRPFVFWVLAFALLALMRPVWFTWFIPYISPGLGVIMLGMGMTLTLDDFTRVIKRPRAVVVGVGAQYIIMPLAAYLLARIFDLDPPLAAGLVIVGSCPGGTASNVITYLAGADVALSVTLTSVSTILSVILTPTLIYLLGGTFVEVDAAGLLLTILQVIIGPVLLGVIFNRYAGSRLKPLLHVFPSVSVGMILLIVASIVGVNQSRIFNTGAILLLAVMMHNVGGYLLGYWFARAARLSERECRTVAIEVGMQNSGLGVALATKHFTEAATALPSAVFSVWHNISGPALASWWRRTAQPPRSDGPNPSGPLLQDYS